MLLYLIRHGDPIYEIDSLTERGKLQAEAVEKSFSKDLDTRKKTAFTAY